MSYFNNGPEGLPGDIDHEPKRNFKLNEITPFGANLAFEVWTVPKGTNFQDLTATIYKNPDLSGHKDTGKFIRFVLNSAPLPLEGVPGCELSKNGFCKLSDFLDGIQVLKDLAEYQFACFANYPSNGQVGDGHPETGDIYLGAI